MIPSYPKFVLKSRHSALLVGFCLSPNSQHVLNLKISVIQSISLLLPWREIAMCVSKYSLSGFPQNGSGKLIRTHCNATLPSSEETILPLVSTREPKCNGYEAKSVQSATVHSSLTSGFSYWFNDVTCSLTVPLWGLPLVETSGVKMLNKWSTLFR